MAKTPSGTKTSSFGSSKRENHDSSAYYSRAINTGVGQHSPDLTSGDNAVPIGAIDQVFEHSSEHMKELEDRSVHLMVTSPPYNVGKDYDKDLSLIEYTSLLTRVLAETYRVLVDGGRACVNIANIGRKPYIPLHSYVIVAASAVGFQMRGEIIWDKGAGAGSSTAWGSWLSASNPTLRDTHEYILVFQKGSFTRTNIDKREPTITKEEFLESTKSVWSFNPESAKKVGHPAPFPVTLPDRLIQLYTFKDDVVLDPFIGAGATAEAAVRRNRHWIGYEIDSEYANLTRQRADSINQQPEFDWRATES